MEGVRVGAMQEGLQGDHGEVAAAYLVACLVEEYQVARVAVGVGEASNVDRNHTLGCTMQACP